MILKYALAWLALAVIAIANGVIREGTYAKHVSALAAHQISTVSAVAFTGVFVWFLHRMWPLDAPAQAWTVGAIWLVMTILFEFGFGHFVVGHPWKALFADYNLLAGRVWALFLVWIFIAPFVIYRISN